jgi:hypothetical protein
MVNSPAVTHLEAEMKLLRWHKLANESALKAAVLKNKALKRKEKSTFRLPIDINAHLNDVIREERSKELFTDESFFRRYREVELKDDADERRRITVQTRRLDSIQKKLEDLDSNRTSKMRCSSMRNHLQGGPNTVKSIFALHDDLEIEVVDSEDETQTTHERSKSIRERMSVISQQLSRPSTVERTKLHFSQYRPKSHGSDPSGMFYSARICVDDND